MDVSAHYIPEPANSFTQRTVRAKHTSCFLKIISRWLKPLSQYCKKMQLKLFIISPPTAPSSKLVIQQSKCLQWITLQIFMYFHYRRLRSSRRCFWSWYFIQTASDFTFVICKNQQQPSTFRVKPGSVPCLWFQLQHHTFASRDGALRRTFTLEDFGRMKVEEEEDDDRHRPP